MRTQRAFSIILLILGTFTLIGCGDSAATKKGAPADGGAGAVAEKGDAATDGELKFIEPFDPPPLDELDAKAEWEDQLVANGVTLLRAQEADEPALVSVEQALALKNDSGEANEKILSALGKLPATPDEVNFDAEVVRHTSGDFKSTSPIWASSVAEFEVNDMIHEGLFAFDWNMKPFASSEVVESWQSSKDRMYDKVVLRDDWTWSDGTPVTAHDVAFTFQVIMHPKVIVPAVKSGTDQLRWVHAYDDRTVVFFHKESLATNVWNINYPLIPKHIFYKSLYEDADPDFSMQKSAYHVKMENNPVTNGPYVVTKRVRGQEIVVERREGWYMHDGEEVRDKPYFKTLRFKLIEDSNTTLLKLKAGEIDEAMMSPEQWITQSDDNDFYRFNTKARGLEWVEFHFGWNVGTPFFDDKRTRQAMSYAFDHKEMIDKLFYGLYQPCRGVFHETSWMAPKEMPEPYQQDLDKAEELLAEAGWEDSDGDGILDKQVGGRRIPFEFTVLCSNTPTSIKVCNLLRESLDRIGIICNVKPTEFTVLQQLNRDHKFHAYFGGWGTGTDPDTSKNIWTTKAITEGRNYIQYSNPRIDELYEQGMREFDDAKRAAIYAEIHEILWEDQPYTWLYYRDSFYGFNKKLRGYRFSPRGPYNYDPGFSSIWTPRAVD